MFALNSFMLALVLTKDIGTSHSLVQDGQNVCSKKRLVKVVDIYPNTWEEDWDCEESYPTSTCELIRSSVIDIKSVYFIKEDFICCPGWLLSENEDECSQSCPDGYFGENCMYECRCLNGRNPNLCDPEDGSCDCLAGWTGRECDERCSPSYYGPNCSQRSIFTCMNGGFNHPDTGHCLCTSQYDGSRCQIDCRDVEDTHCGLILCDNCLRDTTDLCDTQTSSCRCREGWRGRYCTDRCDIGKRGQFCKDVCCSGRGFCIDNGCICSDGYHGDECQYICDAGTFGRRCQEKCECPSSSCNHMTGNCDLCPIGFTGKRCMERCLPTKWGESCNMTCSCGDSVDACDVFTGECPGTGSLLWLLAVVLVVVILLFVGVGCVCFVFMRSSKKVQNEDDQMAGQTENYSTIGVNTSWSHGDYQGIHADYSLNGQDDKAQDQIYNPVYQSTKDYADIGMGDAIYISLEVSSESQPKAQTAAKIPFYNPVYNMDVLEAKQKEAEQKHSDLEETHAYEDLGHAYDNAVFTKKL